MAVGYNESLRLRLYKILEKDKNVFTGVSEFIKFISSFKYCNYDIFFECILLAHHKLQQAPSRCGSGGGDEVVSLLCYNKRDNKAHSVIFALNSINYVRNTFNTW